MYKSYRKLNPKIDNKNWQILFNTQFQNMQKLGAVSTLWINQFSKLGIDNSRRPSVRELNGASKKYTGYRFIQTQKNVITPPIDWYKMIVRYEMPVTNFVRKPSELDYCDEPDSFHDIMTHIPFLMNKEYSDMYQLLARTYIEAFNRQDQKALEKLDFIGGYIIELALIREKTGLKAFGVTLYSSGEVKEAFKKENQIVLGNNLPIEKKSYDRSSFQGKYYIIDSITQIVKFIMQVKKKL